MKSNVILVFTMLLYAMFQPSCIASANIAQDPIDKIISDFNHKMKKLYVDKSIAIDLAKHLDSLLLTGHFSKFNSSNLDEFVPHLEELVQTHTGDNHLLLMTVDAMSSTRNHSERPEPHSKIISDGTGYLNLPNFVLSAEKLTSVVEAIIPCSQLIIDLRDSRGGNPHLVKQLCSYFFERPVHLNTLYWRKGKRYEEFWTSDISEKRLNDVPIYILCNKKTFSASEEFIYNLVSRERATVLGQRTGGGANPGKLVTINKSVAAFIPLGKAINPITKTNWHAGIKPHHECKSELALDNALNIINNN